ncbi:transporter [Altererythrobacter lutimaris]|uniref:Transporter n=1 Tax=Altererythrobacter lutimaris TaxID=2743979 RepID=A0A850HAS5_9SPHN|nr:transporter [Altererythrobacter lutimaris]NVE94345.1 transporter [Altererythrobacter lutimaris]
MKISVKTAICVASAGVFLFASPVSAQDEAQADQEKKSSSAGSFRLNTGISYSNGDYGELEDTEVIAVPISLTYKKDGLRVRVSVPWVTIDGPGSLLATPEGRDAFFGDSGSGQGRGRGRGRGGDSDNSGSGSSSSGSGSGGNDIEVEDDLDDDVIDDDDVVDEDGFAGPDQRRSGIGDVNVSALYSFKLASGTYFEPQVRVKLPTASRADRLGTGEVDVTLSADLVQVVGPMTFYVHGRRKFAGKPEGSTIRSTWGAGGGASVRAGDGVSVGADYFWQQSAFAGRQASSEVSGWASMRVSRDISLTVYGGTGLNDNSADLFGGASVGFRF